MSRPGDDRRDALEVSLVRSGTTLSDTASVSIGEEPGCRVWAPGADPLSAAVEAVAALTEQAEELGLGYDA